MYSKNRGKRIGTLLVVFLFAQFALFAQKKDAMVDALTEAGFENVSRVISETEEIITFENITWKAHGEGIREGIKIIEQFPLVAGKTRRVVVLHYKVPQVSLWYNGEKWQTSYRLGTAWKQAKKVLKYTNDSRWKADLQFHPQLFLRNQKFHKIYDVLLNIAPTLVLSPLPGMKLTGQLLIPVINHYGELYKEIRPEFITIQQRFRVEHMFFEATVGTFNQNRWGMDLALFRPFTQEGWLSHFALDGRIGLTGSSYFYKNEWNFGSTSLLTWNFGGSYYNPRYNVLCELHAEKFIAGDFGVRADMTRHFRRASIGFYIMKNDRDNTDGGFHLAIMLPPYRQKRKHVRVSTANCFTLEYKSAGLFYNGKSYKTGPDQNRAEKNFNPYYIKSQLN